MTMAELTEVFTSINFVFGVMSALAFQKVLARAYSEVITNALTSEQGVTSEDSKK